MVTAVAVVGDEVRIVEFGEGDRLVADSDLAGDSLGVVELRGRQRLAPCGARDRVVAERVARERRDDRGVDAAGKGDENIVALGERVAGSRRFRRRLRGEIAPVGGEGVVAHALGFAVAGKKRIVRGETVECGRESRAHGSGPLSFCALPRYSE